MTLFKITMITMQKMNENSKIMGSKHQDALI